MTIILESTGTKLTGKVYVETYFYNFQTEYFIKKWHYELRLVLSTYRHK